MCINIFDYHDDEINFIDEKIFGNTNDFNSQIKNAQTQHAIYVIIQKLYYNELQSW